MNGQQENRLRLARLSVDRLRTEYSTRCILCDVLEKLCFELARPAGNCAAIHRDPRERCSTYVELCRRRDGALREFDKIEKAIEEAERRVQELAMMVMQGKEGAA